MSTREMAYSILEQLTEEELEGFIALFSRIHPPVDSDMKKRREAFERLETMRRPIPDIDEKAELAAYREERYGK